VVSFLHSSVVKGSELKSAVTSGDKQNFGVSPFPGGALAFSRILNDEEVVVVANTNTTGGQSLDAHGQARLTPVFL
jgi:hypothetical protein